MTTVIPRKYWPGCLSLAVSLCLISDHSSKAAEKVSARTLPKAAPRSTSILSNDIPVVEIPASVFVADFNDRSARDPFYPDASYIHREKESEKKEVPSPVLDNSILKSAKLNGLGGIGDKRWAMINNVTLYLGEEVKLQIGGKLLPIECVSIGEKSVTIGIKGTSIRRQINLE